jgi:hypothetical protein
MNLHHKLIVLQWNVYVHNFSRFDTVFYFSKIGTEDSHSGQLKEEITSAEHTISQY